MRNLLLLLVAVSLFSACKKEPITSTSLTNEIIGTWQLHETFTTTANGQTTSTEDDFTFTATDDNIYTLERPGQVDSVFFWSVSTDDKIFFSMYRSQSDSTYYYATAFEVLSHSPTSLHFSQTKHYNTPNPTTGVAIPTTSIKDWVFAK